MSEKRTIKLSRFTGCGKVKRKDWKDLIFGLVMCGYEVYADEDNIVFELGDNDTYNEEKGKK